jgi:hypothetical protein
MRLVVWPTSAPIITLPESGRQENAAMKTSIADAAGKDGSPSGTTPDMVAPIIIQTVTRVRCRRVRPIIHGHDVCCCSPTSVSKRVDPRL